MKGNSGVDHTFTFVASCGSGKYGFDILDKVSQSDVIISYIKKVDTAVNISIVCYSGKVEASAYSLASEYGIKILGEGDVVPFFDSALLKMPSRPAGRPVRQMSRNASLSRDVSFILTQGP